MRHFIEFLYKFSHLQPPPSFMRLNNQSLLKSVIQTSERFGHNSGIDTERLVFACNLSEVSKEAKQKTRKNARYNHSKGFYQNSFLE